MTGLKEVTRSTIVEVKPAAVGACNDQERLSSDANPLIGRLLLVRGMLKEVPVWQSV